MITETQREVFRRHHGTHWSFFFRSPDSVSELAKNGVLILYANAIIYKGKGILFRGGGHTGKTTISKIIIGNDSSSFIAQQDSPTIYSDGKKTYVVPCQESNRFSVDLGGLLQNNPSLYELKALFKMKHGERRREDESNLVEGVLDDFITISSLPDEQIPRRYLHFFQSLPVYQSFFHETPEKRAEEIELILNQI